MSLNLPTRSGMDRAPLRRQFLLFMVCAAALASSAQAIAGGIRPQDDIVLVNVRPVGSCCDTGTLAEAVQFEAFVNSESGGRRWQRASLESLTSADPSVPTIIFVHGNRLTNWDAKCEGLAAYRRIARQSGDAPTRFVIFSWPSAQIPGPLKDVRVKAVRTRPAGCQLAWLIDQLPAETPVTLVGFSYGARIATGALHILGGGSLGGMTVSLQHPDRQPMNAVLLASALNSDWLCPGRYHGNAMSMVNQMVLVNNCEDMAMKYYHFSTTCGRPQALGFCGPTCIDPASAAKIVQINVARYVGREHDVACYLSAPGVVSEIAGLSSVRTGEAVAMR